MDTNNSYCIKSEVAKTSRFPAKRRATIATETPTKELSPHYATTLEKHAFHKIKEWRKGFAIELDHVLRQRQGLSQLPAKNIERMLDMGDCSSRYHDYNEEANLSHLPGRKSPPTKQALALNMKQRVITELRAFSRISEKGKERSQNSNRGKIILQEIKRKRGQIKCVHDDKDLKEQIESLEKQKNQRIFHDMGSKSDTKKDIKPFHQQYKHNREVDIKRDFMHNKQDAPGAAVSLPSESQVKGVLSTLRESIDTIFTSTIQRVSDLMVITSSSEIYSQNDTQQCDELLRKIEVTKEERDNLYWENMNLKREISDLKRQLAKTFDERAGEIAIRRENSLKNTDSFVYQQDGDYVRINEIYKVVSHLKGFGGGCGPIVEEKLWAHNHGTYAGHSMPEIFQVQASFIMAIKFNILLF